MMSTVWPWIALAGLGAFHGLNPAMGWLFAVALGLHRQSRTAVLVALAPIAVGHFLSVAVVAGAFVATGVWIDPHFLGRAAGLALIGWAAYHAFFGRRHRVRFGMRVGVAGLTAWSFLMATAHGAGLMLVPALMPICFGSILGATSIGQAFTVALAGVLVHSGAMLAVTALIALVVYEWIGLAALRTAWINMDLIWTGALVAAGALLLLQG